MNTLNISVPRAAQEPRGAVWLATAAAALLNALDRIMTPSTSVAAPCGDVGVLRGVARSYEHSDPRMAAELYAVADRHEAMQGH